MDRDATSHGLAIGELQSRFYQGLAETLVRLRTSQGQEGRQALAEIVSTFAATLHVPLAWVGRRQPEAEGIAVLAAAGSAASRAEGLLAGRYAVGLAPDDPVGPLQPSGQARIVRSAAGISAAGAWHEGLLPGVSVAVATRDGGQLALAPPPPGGRVPLRFLDLLIERVRLEEHSRDSAA